MTHFSPCPKPVRVERVYSRYSSIPVTTPKIKKGGKPRAYNKQRQAKEMPRKYGSSHRRKFVRSLDCSACGASGFSQNAHVHKIGAGAGRKGSFMGIAPLCGPRYTLSGCHNQFDEHRSDFDRRFPWYNPEVIAAETERAYVAFCEAEQEMSA